MITSRDCLNNIPRHKDSLIDTSPIDGMSKITAIDAFYSIFKFMMIL